MMTPLVDLTDVTHVYPGAEEAGPAVRALDLRVDEASSRRSSARRAAASPQ
jgi:hypothetical protein